MDESKCKPSQKAFRKKMVDKNNICGRITSVNAGIAHPVERHLAKVEVAPVMELVDMRDLGSRAEMRAGSSPFRRTNT